MRHIDLKWFRALLKARKMSQKELADAIHMNPSSMSLTLSGKREIRLGEAQQIAKVLDLAIEELVAHFGNGDDQRASIVKFSIVRGRKKRKRARLILS